MHNLMATTLDRCIAAPCCASPSLSLKVITGVAVQALDYALLVKTDVLHRIVDLVDSFQASSALRLPRMTRLQSVSRGFP